MVGAGISPVGRTRTAPAAGAAAGATPERWTAVDWQVDDTRDGTTATNVINTLVTGAGHPGIQQGWTVAPIRRRVGGPKRPARNTVLR